MTPVNTFESELAIIGTGLAGMAAAYFSQSLGIRTAQIGVSSSAIYASGYLDLLGVHPVERRQQWTDPFSGIEALVRDAPFHPYARLTRAEIQQALDGFLGFLSGMGLPYERREGVNSFVITPVGTLKPTYAVPESMWAGAVACEKKHPCLIVDFWGLKGFSAIQITQMLSPWPGLRPARIPFPAVGPSVDLYPEQMARSLEIEKNRVRLAEDIRPHLMDAQAVGLPAVLGIYKSAAVRAHLEGLLGVPVFEIPTIPPSLPGFRLKERFETEIARKGVRLFAQKRVLKVETENRKGFVLSVGDQATGEIQDMVRARGVILAGGRFLGMGLRAGRKAIIEPLFGLPVFQPGKRAEWHENDFFNPAGHQINQSGIETDEHFRPLDRSGHPAFENLYAAGSILAHQDWMRQKCGAGLAVATAYAAVRAFMGIKRL